MLKFTTSRNKKLASMWVKSNKKIRLGMGDKRRLRSTLETRQKRFVFDIINRTALKRGMNICESSVKNGLNQ